MTCPKNNEKKSLNELFYLFDQVLSLKDVSSSTLESCCSDALKTEINLMKSQKLSKKFSVEFFKGLMILKCTDIDVVNVTNEIISIINNHQVKKIRYCHRLLPILASCSANITSLKGAFTKLLRSQNEILPKKSKVSIIFESRLNSSLSGTVVIQLISSLIGVEYFLDYNNPDYCIIIEVIKNATFISIVKDYFLKQNYNLQSLAISSI